MNSKIIIICFIIFIYSLNSKPFEEARNNLFIINHTILGYITETFPLYYKPNFINEISEKNNIKTIELYRDSLLLDTYHFDKNTRIKSIIEGKNKIKDFTYNKIEDTLFVSDSSRQVYYKFYYSDGLISSYEYKRIRVGDIFEFERDVDYEEGNFIINKYDGAYYFDANRKLTAFGRYNENILTSLFCKVDIYRELTYEQDSVINTIDESILKKYYRETIPLHHEFNYVGIRYSEKNYFNVFYKGILSYKFIINNIGLVSNIFHFVHDKKTNYKLSYTYY